MLTKNTDGAFTEAHFEAMFALIDAVIPSVVVGDSQTTSQHSIYISEDEFNNKYIQVQGNMEHPPSSEEFREYLATRPVDGPKFKKAVRKTVADLHPVPVKQLRKVLDFMMTRLGNLISTGYRTPFTEQPVSVREAILQSWQEAWVLIWPMVGDILAAIGRAAWSTTDPLLLKLSGYQDYLENRSAQAGPMIDENFMKFDNSIEYIETDVIIVGSGGGGGVCAKILAEAGHQVIVVDKSYYFPPERLPTAFEDTGLLFDARDSLLTVDGSVMINAGSSWGGDGTVNRSAIIKTPDQVRLEWADEHGLELFTTSYFEACLDRVCEAMGVRDSYTKQNDDFGCQTGTKQVPSVSWLPAAAKAGAQFMEGFDVSKVLFNDDNGSQRAIGVVGIWTSPNKGSRLHGSTPRTQQKVIIRAKKVILSSGALYTPLILINSGLKNRNIGNNLHLHPCGGMIATFERDIRSWEGELMTSLVDEFEDTDEKGHGPRVEVLNMLPSITMAQLQWHSGLQFKVDALGYRHMSTFLSLVRDRDTGSVYQSTEGNPLVVYTPSKFDHAYIKSGLLAIAKLCYVRGAVEIISPVRNLSSFKCTIPAKDRNVDDADFVNWLRLSEKTDFSSAVLISGHQMGSCRMSTSKECGVVDEKGAVWETQDLYIADASVFPSASGVNPMVTIMAISEHIARGIAASM
ncbi:long chain fatty alcohol oxidase [Hypoxylon cercidicola]|nr:long chain fatty alcohol oxidase [Hypoxylon cercidicola]